MKLMAFVAGDGQKRGPLYEGLPSLEEHRNAHSLVGSINWVLEIGGAFAGFILGAFFLPLVMFGLHQVLTPIHIEMINSMW